MSDDNLFQTFRVAELDQAEFEQLLLEHFHSARGLNATDAVYPNHEEQYALRLTYDQARLVQVAAGPALTPADIETIQRRIQEDLMTVTGTRVGRLVLFASVPVNGYFRYKNLFQIIPAPAAAPRPPAIMGEHPFLLELTFPTSSNMSVRHLRRAVRERRLELLLSSLLEFSIRSLGRHVRWHWVLPAGLPPDQWSSQYLQEMYTWPGADMEAEQFTDSAGTPVLRPVPPAEYYTRIGIGADRQLEIPSNIEQVLDRFFALPPVDLEKFLRACFWFQHAGKVLFYSRSATFTALVSAVEALIPAESGQPVCPACNRPTGKGPTQKFADFIEEFAPGIPASERRRFYGIRSALSHGGSLLYSDADVWSLRLAPAHVAEWDDSRTILQLVRVVLINWLGRS